jgi:hypothetical protein
MAHARWESVVWQKVMIAIPPSGALLKGYCSACRGAAFAFAVNTEENQRLIKQAFDIHVQEFHVLCRGTNEADNADVIYG